MANRYAAVLRTYFRWPTFSQGLLPAAGLLIIAVSLVMAAFASSQFWTDFGCPIIMPAGVWFVSVGLWRSLRRQVVDERRQLWPGYIGPQLFVFSGLGVMLVCVWPALMAAMTGMNILGLTACASMVFAFFGFWFAVPAKVRMIIGFSAALWIPMFRADTEPMRGMLNGQQNLLSAFVFCVAFAVSAIAVMRMLTMTEEDSDWTDPILSSDRARSQRSTQAAPGREINKSPWLEPKLRLSALAPTHGGIIARSRRWRETIRHYFWIYATLPPLSLAAQYCFFYRPNTVLKAWMLFPTGILLLMPIQMVLSAWLTAWPSVQADLVRPVERRDLIQSIGAAMAIQMSQEWSIAAAVFVAGGVLFHIPISTISSIVFASLAYLIFVVGLVVWGLRYRADHVRSLLGWSMTPVIFFVGFGRDAKWPVFYTTAGASVVTFIGLWLARLAYRRWLETELG